MIRWGRITGLICAVFCVLAPAAGARQATPAYGKAVLTSCDKEAHVATFEGQMMLVKKATKLQMRFTLQASTPESPKLRKIDADGFGEWISAPAGVRKYTYDKTVEALLSPASYRVQIDFRWKASSGRNVRSERAYSPVCRQPDLRPDLVLRNVSSDRDGYTAVVVNRGKGAAGAFDVGFQRNGTSVGSSRVAGIAAGATVNVFLPAPPCGEGEQLTAVVDAQSEVDEVDEENDTFDVSC